MDIKKEQELFALFVHGALSSFHLLGIIYNLKHKKWKWAFFHAVAFTADIFACWEHYKEVRGEEEVKT